MYTRSTRTATQQAKKYNIPGTFVPTGPTSPSYSPIQQVWPQLTMAPVENPPSLLTSLPPSNNNSDDNYSEPKKWMKKGNSLGLGYKLSMREKRRRQNKTLRRLITPKNALMVLNELAAGAQQECTVLPEAEGFGANQINRQYVAILNMGGVEYSGKGSTKLMAKNQAAECVIRDLMIKQMSQLPSLDSPNGNESDDEKEDQSFPMIQLASYALHKLFTEWQTEGYKVPLFGQGKGDQSPTNSTSGATPNTQLKPKKVPSLPANPETLHPCTLLSQMRGTLEYVMISHEDLPMNGQCFTMGVTIDDKTYTGRANNKKEARKHAAAKACKELFGVDYPEDEKMAMNETITYEECNFPRE